MITVLVHVANADAFKVDLEDLPGPSDTTILGKNPRDKADKEANWLEDGVSTVIFPMWRITFIEVLPSEEEEDAFPLPFRND